MKNFSLFLGISAAATFLFACGGGAGSAKDTENTLIFADESFKPLLESSVFTFEALFNRSDVSLTYQPEVTTINSFYQNKTKTIFTSRNFTFEEKKRLMKTNVRYRSFLVAHDAIALIVNKDATDTLITIDQLKDFLSGKVTTWKNGQKISIVFDNVQSANFNTLEKLIAPAKFGERVFAQKSNLEVIDYVKTHPNSIGVVGFNWISDKEDPAVQTLRKDFKIMSVARTAKEMYWQPYSTTILKKAYPLTREMWCINKASLTGDNSSFVNYMMNDKGQLIVEKSGLIPGKRGGRVLNFLFE